MHLITSHLNTDFDSLASMVAIQKLYPDAVICPPGIMNRRVKDFLNHYGHGQGHNWKFAKPKSIQLDQVTLMVVVDTRTRSRIGMFAALAGRPDVVVHVFDHHPPTIDDIPAQKLRYAPLGATVTMIVEQLLKERKSITPEEATLFALGIYDDTGALTFDQTNERDIYVVGRLREIGADLSRALSRIEFSGASGIAEQATDMHLLDTLSENAREIYINGAKVLLTWAVSENYAEGLALLMHKLRENCYSDVTIAVIQNGAKKINIIVRSSPNVLNVKDFLSRWGGGGHEQAGSATVLTGENSNNNETGDAACKKLLDEIESALHSAIPELVSVENVMTSPVLAVATNACVDEAYRTMLRFGYRALPVISGTSDSDGGVVGIITRRDLDKAHLHGLGAGKVSDFMTEGVISISSKASLEEAHRIMATYGFERLPVLEDNISGSSRLVGILTRADLVRGLYRPGAAGEGRQVKMTGEGASGGFLWMESVAALMQKSFTRTTLRLLHRIGAKADELGMKAYLVGGTVRDILMGVDNVDIDIALEGDAEKFVDAWNEPGCRGTVHGRYKTGTITFPDGQKVDIATARREFYEYAAALPTVASDSLKQDIGRRDFTVNAMAIALGEYNWGLLMDYYGGRDDLRAGVLKILHNLSFIEDPSRILRGIRLEQRLGLHFEDNTMRFLMSALKGGILSLLSAPRVRAELELDAKEPGFWKIALRMRDLGVWDVLFPGIKFGTKLEHRLKLLKHFMSRARMHGVDFKGMGWLCDIAVLLKDSPVPVQSAALDRLCLSPSERKELALCLSRWPQVAKFCATHKTPRNSEVYLFFREYSPVQLLFWMCCLRERRSQRFIVQHIVSWTPQTGELTGKNLLDMGLTGRDIGDTLLGIRLARMDGLITSREDEIKFVQSQLEKIAHRAHGDRSQDMPDS